MSQTNYYAITPAIAAIFDVYGISYYTTFYNGVLTPCVDDWASARSRCIQAMAAGGWTVEEQSYRDTLRAYNAELIYSSTQLVVTPVA